MHTTARHLRPLRLCLAAAALAVATPTAGPAAAAGQEHQHQHASPYAGQQDSGIAALTVEELQALETGDGMGLARAAELNHYPGPRHVLDLADDLGLTPEQRSSVQATHARMLAAAVRLGAEIIDRERTLDRRFVHEHVDAEAVREITARIAALQGELRSVHLLAHLETRALLTDEQIRAYDRARGYREESTGTAG